MVSVRERGGVIQSLDQLSPQALQDMQDRFERDHMEHSLGAFTRGAWHVLEPGRAFIPNWHLDAMDEMVQAMWLGQFKKLLINVPPRHTKSVKVGVLVPSWIWTKDAATRFLHSSYDDGLSVRDSVKTRRVVQSPWYRKRWGDRVMIVHDQNQKEKFETTLMGYRLATSVNGRNTGEGGDWNIIDDGHNVKKVESDVIFQGAIDWWNHVMPTRVNIPEETRWIYAGQRVREGDIPDEILKHDMGVGEWVHLNLPAEFEPDKKCVIHMNGFHWEDPRTELNELLWPARFPRAYMEGLKKQLGPYHAAAQLQQRPAPLEGGDYKRTWWEFWQYEGEALPPVRMKQADGAWIEKTAIVRPWSFDEEINSWDMTFKNLESSDFVVGEHLGKVGANCFLLPDMIHDKLSFTDAQDAVKLMESEFLHPGPILVEDTANGPAIMSSLRATVPGLIPVSAAGGIIAKARAFAWVVRAGNVYLPHPDIAPWVWEFINEFAVFPNGSHDDRVAAFAHAMEYFYGVKKPMVPITPEYQAKFFVSELELKPVPGLEAFRFWYFPEPKDGVPSPCCIIGQVLPAGQIRILDCLQVENASVDMLIDRKITPVLNERYRGVWKWRDVGNILEGKPQSSQTSLQRVVMDKLKGSVEPGEPNFEVRVNAIKTILGQTNRMVLNKRVSLGERELLVHEALNGGFAYEADKQGHTTSLTPQKGNKYTAIGEALGHGLARIFVRKPQQELSVKERGKREARDMQKARGYGVRS